MSHTPTKWCSVCQLVIPIGEAEDEGRHLKCAEKEDRSRRLRKVRRLLTPTYWYVIRGTN